MNIDSSLRLPIGGYFADQPKKDLIILHHTVGGSAKSTFEYWRTDSEPIATAYIIERDGTIYEVFPPECWAYHLGLKIGPKGVVDKRSIGIEIASEGPLLARDDKFYAFGRASEQTEFKGSVFDVFNVSAQNTDSGVPHAACPERVERKQGERSGPQRSVGSPDFRGYQHFAAYTPEALASACELVDSLLTRFNIPRQTPEDHTSFDLDGLRNYSGVLTHCQLRADKSDCHPGFDWNKLITGCHLQITARLDIKASADEVSSELMAAL